MTYCARMLVTKGLPFTFYFLTMEVNGNQNGLVTNILQKTVFCVPQRKVSHESLEQHDDEQMLTEFKFLGCFPVKC